MVPLNLTHTNLFSPAHHASLLSNPPLAIPSVHSSGARTPLRHTLSTLLSFFASTYASVFGFTDGPPVHDPLCVAWLSHPELFKGKRYRVDVELVGKETAGTTVVDLWEVGRARLLMSLLPCCDSLLSLSSLLQYKKAEVDQNPSNWGRTGKNVLILEAVDVDAFWGVFQECVGRADLVSPLNKSTA